MPRKSLTSVRLHVPVCSRLFRLQLRARRSVVQAGHLLVSRRAVDRKRLTHSLAHSRHNGTCMEINQTIPGYNATTFQCKCLYGYDGLHCQVVSNMCSNITCENQGICISSYLLWSCKCLDATLYSGLYCQEKSSALAAKQALSYSISIAAIIALCCVAAFVLTMDVLKYVFKIDPVDRERHRLEMEREKEEQRKFKARTRKKERVVFFIPTFPLYRL